MPQERPLGVPLSVPEKGRTVTRFTLIRRMIGDQDSQWVHLQCICPFTITVGGTFLANTVVQLYGWNGELLPSILAQQAAPVSDPIITAGTYTYWAALDYLAATVRNAGSGWGVTVEGVAVETDPGGF